MVLHALSLVALAAQAMTALAAKRSMDWVGVCMLGCITALGNGTIRDVLLGHYPLVWCNTPLSAADRGAALATILIARLVHRLNTAFLVSMRSVWWSLPWLVATSPGRSTPHCHW
jgi:uncharacterized membrane protein YeiH